MALLLELPSELETELADEAARLGLSLSEYALRVLATGRIAEPKPTSGPELLAYWQSGGLVGTRSDIVDAPEHAHTLREKAEKRERSSPTGGADFIGS